MTPQKSVQLFAAAGLLSTSGVLHAHPGHDHNHWFSDLNHALFYVAIAAVIGTGALIIKSRRKSAPHKGENQE